MTSGTARTAKRLAKALSGWLFLFAVCALYVLVARLNSSVVSQALATLGSLLAQVLPVLVLVFGLLFLAGLFLERTWLIRHLGEASGIRGWVITIGCGVLSAGPVYAWYPLLGELRDKGMSGPLIATFLYSRALKLPLLPLMVHYFGVVYTVTLSVGIIVFSVLSGLLMRRLAGHDVSKRAEDNRI